MINMSPQVEPMDRVRTWERDTEIWELYASGEGLNTVDLAARFELHPSTISRILTRMRSAIPLEERQARQRRQIDELDAMRKRLWKLVDAPPIPAYSNGRPIYMADGSIAEDHTSRVRAMDMIVRLHEREAKALGLDAPTRIQAEVRTVNYVIEGVNMEALR